MPIQLTNNYITQGLVMADRFKHGRYYVVSKRLTAGVDLGLLKLEGPADHTQCTPRRYRLVPVSPIFAKRFHLDVLETDLVVEVTPTPVLQGKDISRITGIKYTDEVHCMIQDLEDAGYKMIIYKEEEIKCVKQKPKRKRKKRTGSWIRKKPLTRS